MRVAEIQDIITRYAEGAKRATEVGFDAVEVLAGTGYLISQFLSPISNQRKDQYGGSWENRVRFGLEVAKAIKKVTGDSFPLIFRISGHDLVQGGNSHRELTEVCKMLEGTGVSAINITTGWHESKIPQVTMAVPRGAFIPFVKYIKDNVSIPVVASVRINHPDMVESILENGYADLVGLARPFLADPHFIEKAAADRANLIKPCIACNQGCLDQIFSGGQASCLVNPMVGREMEFPSSLVFRRKKVLIVGAGPAGLEAACQAAKRGHRVTLWEKSYRIGGQLNLAGVTTDRHEFLTLINYYKNQIAELGIKLKLNREATITKIVEFSPDTVLIATGAIPIVPSIPGIDQSIVIQAWDVLNRKAPVGKRIVIVGGGAVGCETALYLAKTRLQPADITCFWGTLYPKNGLRFPSGLNREAILSLSSK